MKILVVEDEKRVARFLESALTAEGHQITLCSTVQEFQEQIDAQLVPFDVAILDRMLQGDDSIRLIPSFKRTFPESKVLILSAINSSEEKAQALDQGADDYMAKPYSLVELSARLRALVRRATHLPQSNPPSVCQCGNMTMDLLSHTVHILGKRVDLSNKEFMLLSTLVRKPGQVFNKFQLLDKVWDTQLDLDSNVVEATVRNIRRKLEESHASIQLLSRRNVGYWIET